MTAAVAPERTGPALRDRLGLAILVALLAACAWLLHLIGGWPHLPAGLPSWRTLTITLQGSYVPDQAAVYLITTLGWLAWLWITLSILMHGFVVVAERLRPGGRWLAALRAVSTRFTLPIVRRTVEAALVATFLLNMGTRAAPMALAASASPAAAAVAPSATNSGPAVNAEPDAVPADVEYTVQPADTLWAIASRFYGSGTDYPKLVAANTGRVMPDGHTFTDAGVIQPGWKLRIPLPSAAIDESGGQVRYLVQPGDTLADIAARMLGDEDRWQQLYAANRNVAKLPDGRVLTSADLIWPGLPIILPLPSQAAPAPPQPAVVVEVPAPAVAPAPASVPATSVAPAPAPVEQPVSVPAMAPAPKPAGRPPLTLLYGFAGSAAAAGAGAATVLARRRRVRRSLQEPLSADEDAPAVVGVRRSRAVARADTSPGGRRAGARAGHCRTGRPLSGRP